MRELLAASVVGLAVTVGAQAAQAGNLTYEPQNPSFGGNPLNGQFLLQTARAQDDNEAPDSGDFGLSQSPADRFKRQLQSRLLGELANQVTNSIFPESGEPDQEGQFRYDNIQVDFRRVSDSVRIDIVDTNTGEVTNISVPTASTTSGE